MAFNIKNESVDRDMRALVALTRESLTVAIAVAVRERLEREQERARRGVEARRSRVRETTRRFAALCHTQPSLDADPTAFLYDEHGLPA